MVCQDTCVDRVSRQGASSRRHDACGQVQEVYLENKFEMAGKATPSPAPMMPLDRSRGTSMKPRSAAVGVKTVKRDHSTTPAPSTTLEEYLVAIYPPAYHAGVRPGARAWESDTNVHKEVRHTPMTSNTAIHDTTLHCEGNGLRERVQGRAL